MVYLSDSWCSFPSATWERQPFLEEWITRCVCFQINLHPSLCDKTMCCFSQLSHPNDAAGDIILALIDSIMCNTDQKYIMKVKSSNYGSWNSCGIDVACNVTEEIIVIVTQLYVARQHNSISSPLCYLLLTRLIREVTCGIDWFWLFLQRLRTGNTSSRVQCWQLKVLKWTRHWWFNQHSITLLQCWHFLFSIIQWKMNLEMMHCCIEWHVHDDKKLFNMPFSVCNSKTWASRK